jgi:hypothetical protein
MNFPFVGPAYLHRSVNVAAQRCINLYPEVVEQNEEDRRLVLIGAPGKRLTYTLPIGPIRAQWVCTNGRSFAVAGYKLYEVFANASYSERGTLSSSTGVVSIADNGLQMMLVDGPQGYILTLATNLFQTITDPDFPGADTVAFQDGYFIFNSPNTGRFYITALYDGFNINALDFTTAEGSPDNIIALLSDHRNIWLFGTNSVEIYFNSGNATFPFERIQGAFIESGCAAKYAIAKLDNTIYWIGNDDKGQGVIYKAQNFSPVRISTHAIEFALQNYSRIDDAIAYTYQQEGHAFCVFVFPSGNATWVYDAATSLWHERGFFNNGVLERDRANNQAFAFGKHLVGDWENGNIYELDLDYYTDNTTAIKRLRACKHLSSNGMNIFYSNLQILLETGVGLDGIQQGTDPKAQLRISRDGGHTFSAEKYATMGKIGDYTARCDYNRLGRGKDTVFEWSTSEPVKVVITGALLRATVGE